MQRINLLPLSERPPEPTAPRLIVTLYIGVATVFSLVVWALVIRNQAIPTIETQIADVEGEIKRLARDVSYYDKLRAENDKVDKRAQLVDDLRGSRVGWARRLDSLWDAVDASRTTWISGFTVGQRVITVSEGKTSRRKKAATKKVVLPQLTLQLRSSSFVDKPTVLDQAAESLIGEFIAHLRQYPDLVDDFEIQAPTTWVVNDGDWIRLRRMTVDFQIVLTAKPPAVKDKRS